jgi:hypothetical protein
LERCLGIEDVGQQLTTVEALERLLQMRLSQLEARLAMDMEGHYSNGKAK